MYKLLLPLDDSADRSRRQAEAVSTLPLVADETTVVLTHILHGEEKQAPKAMQSPERVSTVRDAKAHLEEHGLTVEIREAHAPPADGIIDLAEEIGADHIVMGGRKRSPAGKALFGSVTQRIVLDSDVPVTVTGGQSQD